MEDIFYRQMPHSLEAEQSVLGSMLIDANCVKDVMEQLRPDDFYLKQNREIFETIYSMFVYSKPIDGVTVAGEMEKNGTYEESTTRPYLAQLMDVTPMAREMESTPARSFSTLFCFILEFLLSCLVWFLAAQSPRRRMRVMTFALTALHCTGPKSRLSSACVRQSPRMKTLSSGTA